MLLLPSWLISPPRRRDGEESNHQPVCMRPTVRECFQISPPLRLGGERFLAHLLNHLLELGRHFWNWDSRDLHLPVGVLLEREVELAELRFLVRKIFTEMSAATFLSFERGKGDGFG